MMLLLCYLGEFMAPKLEQGQVGCEPSFSIRNLLG